MKTLKSTIGETVIAWEFTFSFIQQINKFFLKKIDTSVVNRENKASNAKINDFTWLFQMTNTIIHLKQGSSKEDWKLL